MILTAFDRARLQRAIRDDDTLDRETIAVVVESLDLVPDGVELPLCPDGADVGDIDLSPAQRVGMALDYYGL